MILRQLERCISERLPQSAQPSSDGFAEGFIDQRF
jgi:hypothetical protein